MPDVAVSLPTDILSGNSTVAYGADYTFYTTNNGAYYNYTVSATMGDENATVIDNKDGSYTVENVTADLVITASRTAKTFNITFTTNSGAYLPSITVITYGYDISVDVPASAGYANTVTSATYANGGNVSYTLSNGVLCIAGTAVTDDIVIVIDQVRTEITVTLNGSAASDVEEFDPTASVGEDYVLTVNKDSMYNYTVKITVNGQEIDFAAVENTYIIEGKFITASVEQIVITVDKSLNVASLTTSATEYLTLKDDETLWLVKVEAEKIDGKVYYYNEEALFWSDVHNAYCTVIESETKPEINADTLTLVDGTATELTFSMDINRSGKVDANDAQFVYNMYNKMYEGVTDAVTAEKYLRADTNGDGTIDVNDALAIVNAILGK